MRRFKIAIILATVCLAPCFGSSQPNAPEAELVLAPAGRIQPTPQRAGDPERGRHALVDEPLVRCGPPRRMYEAVFGRPRATELLPGRSETNRRLPYYVTAAVGESGIEVVAPNCLSCHAGFLGDELVIGLPNADVDQTFDVASAGAFGTLLVRSVDELSEWRKWTSRAEATARATRLDTIGLASADDLAVALFAHRDPETLEWVDEPRYPLPSDAVPLDIPAWFALEKKAALYYTGAGRGDHARLMMTSAAFCSDSIEEAEQIDRVMPDVLAYLHTIEAPAFPAPVDRRLAASGRALFEEFCAECHGTYGPGEETYPNRLVGLETIGTDPVLARSAVAGSAFVDSFNRSFYGRGSHLTPGDGYVAPPLDGVWATAPYFHNGSVPTLEAVLDRAARPRAWRRRGEDRRAVGLRFSEERTGTNDPRVRDSTRRGQSNRGHAFGDVLTAAERRAVLEYLKTL
jgi:mono/diheme cytochrome c family protein